MRKGHNPIKDGLRMSAGYPHRILLPVYIPSDAGYYQQSLEVLKLCLDSLEATRDDSTGITVVCNGSTPAVVDELLRRNRNGKIDQLIVNAINHGKANVLVPIIRGLREDIISVCDSDVLFLPGWAEALYQRFRTFPECGFLSLAPNPKMEGRNTSAAVLGAAVKGELSRTRAVSSLDLDRFAESIGNKSYFDKTHHESQLTVCRSETVACVGGGHFAFSIRRETAAFMPAEPLLDFDTSDHLGFDAPSEHSGLWRLSLPNAMVYHLGNTPEPWMYEERDRIVAAKTQAPLAAGESAKIPPAHWHWTGRLPDGLRVRLASRIRKSGIFRGQVKRSPTKSSLVQAAVTKEAVCDSYE